VLFGGGQSVLRAGGFLTTLGARRHVVYATQDAPFNYEAMLALDEGNPRRGVRKAVMDHLPTVRTTPAIRIHALLAVPTGGALNTP